MFYLCLNFILYMKNFSKVMLSIIFTTLIVGSVQSVLADEHRLGLQPVRVDAVTDLFKPVPIRNSEYQFHLQVVLRDADNRLISVTESTNGYYIQHDVTDEIFDHDFGKKEIVTVDNIKYEKVQYTNTIDIKQLEHTFDLTSAFLASLWVNFCGEIGGHGSSCIPIFGVSLSVGVISETDVITNHWTILREMN